MLTPIILLAVLRVCACVCLSVISNSSGTGGRSAMPFTSTWRALPGKLQLLFLELIRRVVREEKPLEPFTGNA